jgi:ABC-type multidrug transport system fused ATPase/permease subunit
MGEILSGIELVKVNAWEDKFSERVNVARGEEVGRIRLSEVYKSCNIAVFQATPLLGAAAVFAVKTLVWGDRLESASTFSALAWFNIMFRTLIMLPRGVSHAVEAMVSTRRIERFLFSKDSSLFSERPGGVCTQRESKEEEEQEDGKNDDATSAVVLAAKQCSWSWNAPSSPFAADSDSKRAIPAENSLASTTTPGSSHTNDEKTGDASVKQPASHAGIRNISFELKRRSLLTITGEI